MSGKSDEPRCDIPRAASLDNGSVPWLIRQSNALPYLPGLRGWSCMGRIVTARGEKNYHNKIFLLSGLSPQISHQRRRVSDPPALERGPQPSAQGSQTNAR